MVKKTSLHGVVRTSKYSMNNNLLFSLFTIHAAVTNVTTSRLSVPLPNSPCPICSYILEFIQGKKEFRIREASDLQLEYEGGQSQTPEENL